MQLQVLVILQEKIGPKNFHQGVGAVPKKPKSEITLRYWVISDIYVNSHFWPCVFFLNQGYICSICKRKQNVIGSARITQKHFFGKKFASIFEIFKCRFDHLRKIGAKFKEFLKLLVIKFKFKKSCRNRDALLRYQ